MVLLWFLNRQDACATQGASDSNMQTAGPRSVSLASRHVLLPLLLIQEEWALITVEMLWFKQYEPRCEKTGIRGFRPGPTQTGLYSHRK